MGNPRARGKWQWAVVAIWLAVLVPGGMVLDAMAANKGTGQLVLCFGENGRDPCPEGRSWGAIVPLSQDGGDRIPCGTTPSPQLSRLLWLLAQGRDGGYWDAFFPGDCRPPSAPTATTGGVSHITPTSATLNGTANDQGSLTSVGFEYGRDAGSATWRAIPDTIEAVPDTLEAGTGETAVHADLTGLDCATTYQYRVVATSSTGTAYGADRSFTTQDCAAVPLTISVVGDARGSVISSPEGISCPDDCTKTYPLVRQAKLGASCRVKVPVGERS